MNKFESREMVSALADGELDGEALGRCLDDMLADPALQSDWAAYHLIGDVLRSPELACGAAPGVFIARLQDRLQAESVSPAEVPDVARADRPLPVTAVSRDAANDGNFRWKLVAGFASLAAVAAIGWNALSLPGGGISAQPQLASAPAQQPVPVVASSENNNVMIRDARLDELMAAHRQLGSGAAIQMPSGALRNAAFETPVR
jgi:sigma-E factor negative regulatory protein RseA